MLLLLSYMPYCSLWIVSFLAVGTNHLCSSPSSYALIDSPLAFVLLCSHQNSFGPLLFCAVDMGHGQQTIESNSSPPVKRGTPCMTNPTPQKTNDGQDFDWCVLAWKNSAQTRTRMIKRETALALPLGC